MVVMKEDERLAFSHGDRDKHFYFKPGWWWWTQSKIWKTSKAFSGISHGRMNTLLGSLIAFDLGKNSFISNCYIHDVQTLSKLFMY